jgi:hypothetical protein
LLASKHYSGYGTTIRGVQPGAESVRAFTAAQPGADGIRLLRDGA